MADRQDDHLGAVGLKPNVPDDLYRIIAGPLKGYWFCEPGPSHWNYLTGSYEPAIQSSYGGLLPGGTFYDLGAHYGFHTIFGARLVGPAGVVYAFEPQPKNREHLVRNIAANGLEHHVVVWPAAVSDEDGEAEFHIATERSDLGKLSTEVDHAEWNDQRIAFERVRVPTVRLDTFVQQWGIRPPTCIKIDVEGSEAKVLRGAMHTLQTYKPVLILSTHGTRMLLACLEILTETKYQTFPIHGDDVLLCLWCETPAQVDSEPITIQLGGS